MEEPVALAVAVAARKNQKAQRLEAQRPEMTERGRRTLSRPGGAGGAGGSPVGGDSG